jgi:hypothetical protein
MTDEATGGNTDAEAQQTTVMPNRGVAEMTAALFGDYLANIAPIQDSGQRVATASIAFMDRIILLAGGTLTLIFTVLGSVSAHLYDLHQQAQHVLYVLISCWLLVVAIISGLIYNKAAIRLGHFRDAAHTVGRADSLMKIQILKMPHVTDVDAVRKLPSLLGASNVESQIKSFSRIATIFGTIAQWALAAAFIFLVLFIQGNISLMLAAAPHK